MLTIFFLMLSSYLTSSGKRRFCGSADNIAFVTYFWMILTGQRGGGILKKSFILPIKKVEYFIQQTLTFLPTIQFLFSWPYSAICSNYESISVDSCHFQCPQDNWSHLQIQVLSDTRLDRVLAATDSKISDYYLRKAFVRIRRNRFLGQARE